MGDRLASAFRYVQASLAGDLRQARIPRGWNLESADILSRLLTLVAFQARLLAGLEQFAAADRPLYAVLSPRTRSDGDDHVGTVQRLALDVGKFGPDGNVLPYCAVLSRRAASDKAPARSAGIV